MLLRVWTNFETHGHLITVVITIKANFEITDGPTSEAGIGSDVPNAG